MGAFHKLFSPTIKTLRGDSRSLHVFLVGHRACWWPIDTLWPSSCWSPKLPPTQQQALLFVIPSAPRLTLNCNTCLHCDHFMPTGFLFSFFPSPVWCWGSNSSFSSIVHSYHSTLKGSPGLLFASICQALGSRTSDPQRSSRLTTPPPPDKAVGPFWRLRHRKVKNLGWSHTA